METVPHTVCTVTDWYTSIHSTAFVLSSAQCTNSLFYYKFFLLPFQVFIQH